MACLWRRRRRSRNGAPAVALAGDRSDAAFDPARQDPALADLRVRLDDPIGLPTLALSGADDIRLEPMGRRAHLFTASSRFDVVPDCGHVLHCERPDAINRHLIDWLKDDRNRA